MMCCRCEHVVQWAGNCTNYLFGPADCTIQAQSARHRKSKVLLDSFQGSIRYFRGILLRKIVLLGI